MADEIRPGSEGCGLGRTTLRDADREIARLRQELAELQTITEPDGQQIAELLAGRERMRQRIAGLAGDRVYRTRSLRLTEAALGAVRQELAETRARVAELDTSHAAALHTIGVMACEGLADADRIAELERRADTAEAAVERVRAALDWLGGVLATSARDWATSRDLALIYGVILGWHNPNDPDDDGGALREIAALFPHGSGVIDRMQEHRATVRALDAASTQAECKQAAEKLNPPADSSRSRALPAVLETGPCDCTGQAAEITEAIRVLRAALGTPTTEPDDTQPCDATSNGTRCYKPAGHQTHRGTPGPGQTRWWTDATSTPAAEPDSGTDHTGAACPNRIDVTPWPDAQPQWLCGCLPDGTSTAG